MRLLFAALLVVAIAIICLMVYALVMGLRGRRPLQWWKVRRAKWQKQITTKGGKIYVGVRKGDETNTLAALDPDSVDFEIRLAEETDKAERIAMDLNANEGS